MHDYDAELARLEERKREVRREKVMGKRRRDTAIDKELRKVFSNVRDDVRQLRQFLLDMGAISRTGQTNKRTADDYAHVPFWARELLAGVKEAQRPLARDLLPAIGQRADTRT